MLRRKKQQKYFKKRWKSAITHLNAFTSRRNPEALHRLRVDIKKIKALVWLSEECLDSADFSKSIELISETFHDAGEIRSAQLALKLLKKYKIKNNKFHALESSVSSSGAKQFRLKKAIHVNNINTACKEMFEEFRDIDRKCVLKLFKDELHKLQRSFSKKESGRKLHQDRKKIKYLMYICKMLPYSLNVKLDLNVDYLDEVQEAIGKWHDPYGMIELMKEDGIDNKEVKRKLKSQVKRSEKVIYRLTAHFKKRIIAKR
jgi:CHAD domain-containing protein